MLIIYQHYTWTSTFNNTRYSGESRRTKLHLVMDGWINGHFFVFQFLLSDLKTVCFVVMSTVRAESKHVIQRMKCAVTITQD